MTDELDDELGHLGEFVSIGSDAADDAPGAKFIEEREVVAYGGGEGIVTQRGDNIADDVGSDAAPHPASTPIQDAVN